MISSAEYDIKELLAASSIKSIIELLWSWKSYVVNLNWLARSAEDRVVSMKLIII